MGVNLDAHRLTQCAVRNVWVSDGSNKHFPFMGVFELSSTTIPDDALRGNRPYLTLQAGKNDHNGIKVLFDTGAVTSVLSTEAFQWFKTRDAVRQKLDTTGLCLTTASGANLAMTGAHVIDFRCCGKKMSGVFVTVPQLSSVAILGMNVITPNLLTLCPGTLSVMQGTPGKKGLWSTETNTAGQDTKWEHAEIRVHRPVSIKAETTTRVKCRLVLPSQGGRCVGPNTPFFGHVLGLPIHAITDEKGFCRLYIPNGFPNSLQLTRAHLVGSADNQSLWDRAQLTSELAAVFFAATGREKGIIPTQNTAPPHLSSISPAKKAAITKAVQDVPAEDRPRYKDLLMRFANVFSSSPLDLGHSTTVVHDIQLRSQEPVYTKQFPLPPDEYELIKRSVGQWVKIGIVEPAHSKYNSPLFCVRKKGTSDLRVVLDYRKLNAQSLPDHYSIRSVDECIREIGYAKSRVFSALDNTSSFWQMALASDARPLTAFTLPGVGQFQWKTAPMGLMGCPASYSRLMTTVMTGLDHVLTYVDDTLVHSKDRHEHLRHLQEALQRMKDHNLKLNLNKCVFAADKVAYLGHTLTASGIIPGLDKAKAIRDAPMPDTSNRVKSFVGLANYFRNYIKDFSRKAAPLHKLSSGETKWRGGQLPPEAEQAFRTLQHDLSSEPVLAFPTREGKFHLYVDGALGSSDGLRGESGLGAVLLQEQLDAHGGSTGAKRPVAFASRALLKQEKNYSAFLIEMQAAVYGIEYFAHYLRGRRFILYTDHRPLESLNNVHTKTLSRLEEKLQEFHFEIRYVKGKDNAAADYLSRSAGSGCIAVVETDESMRDLQYLDKQIRECIKAREGVPFNKEAMGELLPYLESFVLHNGVLQIQVKQRKGLRGGSLRRWVVPSSMRPKLIHEGHNSAMGGHSGFFKTSERVKELFWWPGIDKDIEAHIRQCVVCHKASDKGRTGPQDPQTLPDTSRPNERVHADLYGPSRGRDGTQKYILVATDAFTKIVRLSILPDKTAASVAKALVEDWVFIYGVPAQIHTDQGGDFKNQLATAVWDKLKVNRTTTTPYHPACNGQAEVFNKTMTNYLKKMILQAGQATTDWEEYVGPLMFSHNTAVHKATMMSPFYCMFGYSPRAPIWPGMPLLEEEETTPTGMDPLVHHAEMQRMLRKQAQHNNQHYKDQYVKQGSVTRPPMRYQVGQEVWFRVQVPQGPNKKLWPPYEEGIIMVQKAQSVYIVKRCGGSTRRRKHYCINAEHIKPRTQEQQQPSQPDISEEAPQQRPVQEDPDEVEDTTECLFESENIALGSRPHTRWRQQDINMFLHQLNMASTYTPYKKLLQDLYSLSLSHD